MSTLDGLRSDGRCHLNFDVDGVQITRLFAHVDSRTVMRAVEYPAESRVVLDLATGPRVVWLSSFARPSWRD